MSHCVRYPGGFEGHRKPSRLVQWRTYAKEMEKENKFCLRILKKHTKELLIEKQRSRILMDALKSVEKFIDCQCAFDAIPKDVYREMKKALKESEEK